MSKAHYKKIDDLLSKYPELKQTLNTNPIAFAWVNSWIRTDKNIEEGLIDLVQHLVKYSDDIKEHYHKHLETKG